MRVIRQNRNKTSSTSISAQIQKEAEGRGGDSMEVVEVLVTDTADVISVENITFDNVRAFTTTAYEKTDHFLRI